MAYRRPKSLRDLLAKLKTETRDHEPLDTHSSASVAIIKLRSNTYCKTTNVVYLITCTECGKQYASETGDHVN